MAKLISLCLSSSSRGPCSGNCVEQGCCASARRLFTCVKGREAWFNTGLANTSWESRNLSEDRHGVLVLGAEWKTIPALKNRWVALLLIVKPHQGFSVSARGLFTWGEKAQAWFKTIKERKAWDTRNLEQIALMAAPDAMLREVGENLLRLMAARPAVLERPSWC